MVIWRLYFSKRRRRLVFVLSFVSGGCLFKVFFKVRFMLFEGFV